MERMASTVGFGFILPYIADCKSCAHSRARINQEGCRFGRIGRIRHRRLSHWNRRLPHYSLPACLPRSPQPLASDPRSSMPLWGPRREIERLRTISRPWLRPQSQEPLTRLRRVPARTPATRCNSVLPADFPARKIIRVPVPPFSLPPKPPLCPHPVLC